MTVSIRFVKGERWVIAGMTILFDRELGDDRLLFYVERTLVPFQLEDSQGNKKQPNGTWAIAAFAEGRLKRLDDRDKSAVRRLAANRDWDADFLNSKDPKARLRWLVVREFDKLRNPPRNDAAIATALQKLWADDHALFVQFRRPCPRSVRRWLKGRGAPGDRRLRQMVSMSARVPRPKRMEPVTHKLMAISISLYWSKHGWSIEDGYSHLSGRLFLMNKRRLSSGSNRPALKMPSRETYRKAVRGSETFETYSAKWGEKLAKQRFKAIGNGLAATRALELGCMDHTLLDGILVIDVDWMLPVGRPWLTIIIDVKTRCIVGFVISFVDPSTYSAMECIRRANRPKPHLANCYKEGATLQHIFGRFDEIVVDNGKEFAGTSFEDAMADVGTSLRIAPIASPKHKAIVERFFGTLNKLLNQKLPGGVLKPDLMKEMGYDPVKDAVLTVDELEVLIWDAISTYHCLDHRTLRGRPVDYWRRDMEAHAIPVIGDDAALGKMLGAIVYPRTLTTSGIELFGLTYRDKSLVEALLADLAPLEPIRQRRRRGSATARVKVKYNPANLSEIHVYNHLTNCYVTLPCCDSSYATGLSLWHHNLIKQWAKSKNYETSTETDRLLVRSRLIKNIESSAPELRLKQRRVAARLFNPPRTDTLPPGTVTAAFAPARHDGLAPVIQYDTLSSDRTDCGLPSSRPARKKKALIKPKRSGANKNANADNAEGEGSSGVEFPVNVYSKVWKDFGDEQ